MAASNPPADITELQRKLQEAQEERRKVLAMRHKTDSIAERARRLLVENHFAERVRGTFS